MLEIKKTKASAVCAQCKNSYEVRSFYSGCPECGTFERTVQSGYECVIDSIEMETEYMCEECGCGELYKKPEKPVETHEHHHLIEQWP